MEDGIIGAVLAVIFCMFLYFAFDVGQMTRESHISNDCDDFGKVKVKKGIYKCKFHRINN